VRALRLPAPAAGVAGGFSRSVCSGAGRAADSFRSTPRVHPRKRVSCQPGGENDHSSRGRIRCKRARPCSSRQPGRMARALSHPPTHLVSVAGDFCRAGAGPCPRFRCPVLPGASHPPPAHHGSPGATGAHCRMGPVQGPHFRLAGEAQRPACPSRRGQGANDVALCRSGQPEPDGIAEDDKAARGNQPGPEGQRANRAEGGHPILLPPARHSQGRAPRMLRHRLSPLSVA
jgi:hypothetical protein